MTFQDMGKAGRLPSALGAAMTGGARGDVSGLFSQWYDRGGVHCHAATHRRQQPLHDR